MNDVQELSVEITTGDGWVAVTAGSSTAVIERVGEVAVAKSVPIGTRAAASLRMRVDDRPVRVRPGPGRYARGSYKVVADHGGVIYRLRPKSPDVSRLSRDNVRLGDFELKADGSVQADWYEENRGSVIPADAAVGYALAVAFGTGARFFLVMLLDVLTAAGPD